MDLNPQSFSIPFRLTAEIDRALERWRREDLLARLWARDASLWTGDGEGAWLGWLDAPARADSARYGEIARDVSRGGFSDAVVLGMGGSVLCPAVFSQAFVARKSFPRLHVLDSVDPGEVRRVEEGLDPARTLFIVSSKSGTTLESRVLAAHFLERVRLAIGPDECGRRFLAITDPGTPLDRLARELSFRRICSGEPDIGGRFSAFSDFGLVPLATMGVDVGAFLAGTMPMVTSCGSGSSVLGSPGVLLGVILGVLARSGRDKVCFTVSQSVGNLALWLEQLLAESTGKSGAGIVPVAGRPLASPGSYGVDRVFVYIAMESDSGDESAAAIAALEEAGRPVVRIGIPDALSIGQELFRWEIATAVAGAELGVNPFDQPDVEASKAITRELMAGYERDGAFAPETPVCESRGLRVFVSDDSGAPAGTGGPEGEDLEAWLAWFLGSVRDGDYVSILAYSPMDRDSGDSLEALRASLGRGGKVPTTVGFGPRYLHSSGQLHKGGPNTGVFLVLVSEDARDLPVPGHAYTFGVVKAAQARADTRALAERGRRVMRIHVGGSFGQGVSRLAEAAPPDAVN